jgi:ADP-dependent glucokinase
VQLVGPVGPRLAALLDERVQVAERVAEDEVHLILEYNAGDEWGDSKAPVATRYGGSILKTL